MGDHGPELRVLWLGAVRPYCPLRAQIPRESPPVLARPESCAVSPRCELRAPRSLRPTELVNQSPGMGNGRPWSQWLLYFAAVQPGSVGTTQDADCTSRCRPLLLAQRGTAHIREDVALRLSVGTTPWWTQQSPHGERAEMPFESFSEPLDSGAAQGT